MSPRKKQPLWQEFLVDMVCGLIDEAAKDLAARGESRG